MALSFYQIFGTKFANTRGTSQPKSQPKPASAAKAGRKRERGGRASRGRNAGRRKPKTAEELDADMADYFGDAPANNDANNAAPAATNGAAPAAPAGGEDLGMDEVSVSSTNMCLVLPMFSCIVANL